MAVEPTVQELFSLRGKVALVTGGSGHLGSALARGLAEAGASVILSSRDEARAREAIKPLPVSEGAEHFPLVLDHMQPESLPAAFERAIALAGKVDVLLNNGHEALGADWTTVTAEQFSHHLANATGYFELARLVRNRAVAQQQPASVIMLGSMYGVVGSYPEAYEGVCPASPVAYHTLKGGIVHMTRHLAVYWGPDRVRVNCLSPGPFPRDTAPAGMVDRLKQKSPMQRMGKPHELKGAVVFLASDASSYVTGQNLLVDGGWTAW
ncbi:General stress protein 39 [Anatilimnocola aggregata]|uniref:General stress protein 39 n=1 Tax=Anatilimnocola aggregata TaxID=2528021 RepID=A0A517YNB0_9BACT|nr:SDR family oxidoreductase [Anatilimnocola aggregata]QDU31726.1 General stress protein 39 [Anatilimnocola aggregata]